MFPLHVPDQKFSCGRVVMTASISMMIKAGALSEEEIRRCLERHLRGDWGEVGIDDWEANEDDLLSGERLFSRYDLGNERIYIITERDRSYTTIMMAEDY